MRNLLALLAFGLLAFAVMGWYLDWYSVHSVSSDSGRSSFQIEINQNKIGEDSQRIWHKGTEKLKSVLKPDDEDKELGGSFEEAEPKPGLE